MKLTTLESRNLMPFFHIYVLKSRKYDPAKYCLLKIAKLSTNKVRTSYLDASSIGISPSGRLCGRSPTAFHGGGKTEESNNIGQRSCVHSNKIGK